MTTRLARRGVDTPVHGDRSGSGVARRGVQYCRCNDGAKLFEVDGFGKVVKGPSLERADRVLRRTIGGDDHTALLALLSLQPYEQVDAHAVGQAHVGDDHVKRVCVEQLLGFLQAASGLYPVAFA